MYTEAFHDRRGMFAVRAFDFSERVEFEFAFFVPFGIIAEIARVRVSTPL